MGMASVSSLEDIIGGHIWIGFILLIGGAWHILVVSKTWATKLLRIIDADNQPELTEERVKNWVAQIKRKFT
jgi:hypothetical protein